jgi:hypothetical protein
MRGEDAKGEGVTKRITFGQATCGDCDLPLAFYRLPNGKACPCNPDGSDHWDTCREVRYARAKKGELKTHKFRRGGGYVKQWEGATVKPFKVQESTGVKRSKLPICDAPCGIPPWEDCTACPLRVAA